MPSKVLDIPQPDVFGIITVGKIEMMAAGSVDDKQRELYQDAAGKLYYFDAYGRLCHKGKFVKTT